MIEVETTSDTSEETSTSMSSETNEGEAKLPMRNQGILDIASVEYAVLETNGRLNIILTPEQQPVTAAQMGVTPDDTGYFSILINNGRIIDKKLKRMGRDERWLQKQLQKRGAQSVRDVYLLMLNDAGQIYFAAKEPI